MEKPARLFNCARCQCQVIICSFCDRGNIYCGSHCSKAARRESVRNAGKRYQNSRCGKLKHARRQQCYRQREKIKVTHQCSLEFFANDLLSSSPISPIKKSDADEFRCHFCTRRCSGYLRLGFLGRYSHDESYLSSSWSLGP